MFLEEPPSFFIAGYGANQRTDRHDNYREPSSFRRFVRVEGVFKDYVGLVPFSYKYERINEFGRYEECQVLLNRLLPPDVNLTEQNIGFDSPRFLVNDILLPFSALSDGYKALIGWVWDLLCLLSRVCDKNKPLTELPGVVIVDEVDLFLHPEWQRTVVGSIAEAFPNLQFLFSTHSPLVASSLEAENIFIMETDDDGAAVVKQYRERAYGLSASEMLTSSYFGLSSTRAPGSDDLSDYVKNAMSDDEEAIRAFLRQTAKGIPKE